MSWKASQKLMDTIKHYAKFPATGVSLRQMVQFGEKPSTGMFPVTCDLLSSDSTLRYSVPGFAIPRRGASHTLSTPSAGAK